MSQILHGINMHQKKNTMSVISNSAGHPVLLCAKSCSTSLRNHPKNALLYCCDYPTPPRVCCVCGSLAAATALAVPQGRITKPLLRKTGRSDILSGFEDAQLVKSLETLGGLFSLPAR